MAVGIICEFNPFHNGHEYILKKASEYSLSGVVCAMSGNFVQRGEYACADKYVRAAWALSSYADAVIENPFPYSCAGAEIFAESAVKLLFENRLCTSLAFGAENDERQMFFDIADILLDKKTAFEIKKLVKSRKKISFAEARCEYISEKYGEKYSDFLKSPNNILGVEYTKAIIKNGYKSEIFPIKRIGAVHDGRPEGKYCSASYLREDFSTEKLAKYCPSPIFADEIDFLRTDKEKFFAALSAKIILSSKDELSEIAELPQDFIPKLKKSALICRDYDSFFGSLKVRHMTDAKLRRMLLYTFFGTKKHELKTEPSYALLLGCNGKGASLVKKAAAVGKLPVLSKISDSKRLEPCIKEKFDKVQLAEKAFSKFVYNDNEIEDRN